MKPLSTSLTDEARAISREVLAALQKLDIAVDPVDLHHAMVATVANLAFEAEELNRPAYLTMVARLRHLSSFQYHRLTREEMLELAQCLSNEAKRLESRDRPEAVEMHHEVRAILGRFEQKELPQS